MINDKNALLHPKCTPKCTLIFLFNILFLLYLFIYRVQKCKYIYKKIYIGNTYTYYRGKSLERENRKTEKICTFALSLVKVIIKSNSYKKLRECISSARVHFYRVGGQNSCQS